MKISPTKLNDVKTISIEYKNDARGYFVRTFCKDELAEINFDIAQINQSLTKDRGTIRGLHFQKQPKAEKKIIQCIQGKIYDVVVDIRPESKQYGDFYAVELSEKDNTMIYIPEGYAHGFQTLTDNCLVQYYMDEFYSPDYASGIAWNDPILSIPWPIKNPQTSPRDNSWPFINK